MQELQVQALGRENPLKKEMATHSSTLVLGSPIDRGAWKATVHGMAKNQTWLRDETNDPTCVCVCCHPVMSSSASPRTARYKILNLSEPVFSSERRGWWYWPHRIVLISINCSLRNWFWLKIGLLKRYWLTHRTATRVGKSESESVSCSVVSDSLWPHGL